MRNKSAWERNKSAWKEKIMLGREETRMCMTGSAAREEGEYILWGVHLGREESACL